MKKSEPELPELTISDKKFTFRTIISLCIFFIIGIGAWLGYKWVNNQPKIDRALAPLRKTLQFNENVFTSVFDTGTQVTEYPVSAAVKRVRVNGMDGLRTAVDTGNWRLQVIRSVGDTLSLTMDDIKKLPKKDIVFNFKCIEGWSQITHWAGVPLQTFLDHYNLKQQKEMKYLGLITPDKQYYVGIDMLSALQPQTILCYEMNGKPLPLNQGYPLRLIIPVKYGIKHLKRIGTMSFSNQKPPDYWAERGYDYYAGH